MKAMVRADERELDPGGDGQLRTAVDLGRLEHLVGHIGQARQQDGHVVTGELPSDDEHDRVEGQPVIKRCHRRAGEPEVVRDAEGAVEVGFEKEAPLDRRDYPRDGVGKEVNKGEELSPPAVRAVQEEGEEDGQADHDAHLDEAEVAHADHPAPILTVGKHGAVIEQPGKAVGKGGAQAEDDGINQRGHEEHREHGQERHRHAQAGPALVDPQATLPSPVPSRRQRRRAGKCCRFNGLRRQI